MPRRLSISERISLFSTLTVPTRTGRPASVISTTSSMSASNLASSVRKTRSALVVADHRPVGRDGDHVEAVDLEELLLLGHRRAGHAGQLVVEAEVVLEGDRGERHRLALDAQALLGLDGLVEALRPAAAGHLAAGELVDDDDLAVLDDVVAVALVERVGLAAPARSGAPGAGRTSKRLSTPSSFSILSMPSSVGETACSLRSMK